MRGNQAVASTRGAPGGHSAGQLQCVCCGSDTLRGNVPLTNSMEIKISMLSWLRVQTHPNLFATHWEQHLWRLGSCLPSAALLALTYLDRFFFREAEPKFISIMRSASKPPLISLGALWAFPVVFTNLERGYLGTMLMFLNCRAVSSPALYQ